MTKKELKFKIEYMFFIGLTKLILILPQSLRFKIASGLGGLAYHILKKRKIVSLANISLAFPNMSEEEKEKIAKKSYKIMGKAFITSLWFEDYFKNEKNIKINGMENLDEVMARGKGCITACMHMGNMEASLFVGKKYPIATVAKNQKNPYINDYIINSRKKQNIILLQRSRSNAKDLIRLLDKKYIIALFCDHKDLGSEINFFGRKAQAPNGPVSLALKNDIPLILQYNILNDDNTCTINFSKEIQLIKTGNFKDDVEKNVQLLINEVEKVILKHPEQWMWVHDRWAMFRK